MQLSGSIFLFCLASLQVFAQFSSEGKGLYAQQPVAAITWLRGFDPVQQIAIFEDTKNTLHVVARGQSLQGTSGKLTRIFSDRVEISVNDEENANILFLRINENFAEKYIDLLKTTKTKSLTDTSIEIIDIKETSGSLSDRSENRANKP